MNFPKIHTWGGVSEWNNIVENSSDGTIYQTHGYELFLSGVYGYPMFQLKEGKSIFPIMLVKSPIFGNRMISMPFSDYGGPIIDNEKNAKKLADLAVDIAKSTKSDFIEIRSPNSTAAKFLHKSGFKKRTDYCTFILDLSKTENDLLSKMEKRTRNDLNKAKRQNLEIREIKDSEEINQFYKIYLANMKNLGSPPQPFNHFFDAFRRFYPNSIRVTICSFEQKPIAAMLMYLHKKKAHYAFGVSLPNYRTYRASDLLIWDAILWSKNKGVEELDFGRTRFDSGVYFYKKGWGGKEIPMDYYYKFLRKRLDKRQEQQFGWASKLWKLFVPRFIARLIGPWIIKQVG